MYFTDEVEPISFSESTKPPQDFPVELALKIKTRNSIQTVLNRSKLSLGN